MNVKTQRRTIFATLLFGAVMFIGGCATTGMERAIKTTNKMETVENDMKLAMTQVDSTGASLQSLISSDQTNLKQAFDSYSANVDQMEKFGNQLNKHSEQMAALGKEYFTEWEKEGNKYTNPNIREASEERRTVLSNMYNKVPETNTPVREALSAYLSDLKQIRSYLLNDLTPRGIESITPVAQKAIIDGENLKNKVTPVLSAMDRAAEEMYGTRGTAAGGAEKEK